MSAKYQIKIPTQSGVTATTLNIPITLEPAMAGQCELINKKFIEVEVEKSINPILDYEKARLIPTITGTTNNVMTHTQVDRLIYDIKFASAPTFPTGPTTYFDIGITNDDIKFGKKKFENSHVTLSFYDSDKAANQRLMSFINIFPRLTAANIIQPPSQSAGLPLPANQIPVSFMLSDPIKNPDGFAEGYYIYHFKDEIPANLPKVLYMRATYNNASTGKQTNMITEGQAFTIDNLVNKLYTKYVLYRDATGYFYVVDSNYSNNVSIVGQYVTVNLYEIQAL